MQNRFIVIGITLVIMAFPLHAQTPGSVVEFYGKSLDMNNIGMSVLGGWALANISIGAIGWSQQNGQQAYFHQMNLFWNTVNLSIAGFALYNNLSSEYVLLTGEELMERQFKSQRLFLINGGIDVAYLATGFLLRHLAPKYPKQESRLLGYGNSVILQGSFLFVFDLVMYGIQISHRAGFLDQLSFSPMQDAWGLVASFQF